MYVNIYTVYTHPDILWVEEFHRVQIIDLTLSQDVKSWLF